MNYKAVLFDLDGTLLNSLEDIADSMNHVLKRFGFPTHETEAYKLFIGDGIKKLIERVLPHDKQDEETARKFLFESRKYYEDNCMRKTKKYNGISELLDELTKLSVRKSILSNKPHNLTNLLVLKILYGWNFDVVFGERPEYKTKPDPEAALEIARIMKIKPEEFVYVGDSSTDMKTAIAAGMFPVGVLWGFRSAEELRKAGAKELINKPIDLLKFFR